MAKISLLRNTQVVCMSRYSDIFYKYADFTDEMNLANVNCNNGASSMNMEGKETKEKREPLNHSR